jgi:DMSO/TMAO reductase YedYZ molybdopterin-dependent catalytic subunit
MLDDLNNRRDQEEKIRKEGRLPPGQALTQKFPVLHYGPVPRFNAATWDLRAFGEVEEEMRWTWDEFNKLPKRTLTMDIHCVTRWSKFDTSWEGVSLKDLVDQKILKLKKSAKYLLQHAEYGFTVNVPVDVAMADNFLLATKHNGEDLTPDHGYPLRGVVGFIPGRNELETPYLWKGAKWLRGLEFLSEDQQGFWEQAGYHNRANVWKEERFARGGW